MPGPGVSRGLALASWAVGAAYMPPGTFAAAETPRAAYMRPLRIARKRLPAWRGVGDAAPYRRILFALSANSTFFIIYYLLSLIYLLFAAFVV